MPPDRTPERTPEQITDRLDVEQLAETASTLAYEASPLRPNPNRIGAKAVISLADSKVGILV